MANKRVVRFGGAARFVHWGHTVSFIILLLTGLPLFSGSLAGMAWMFGGFHGANLVHRIAAVVFIIVPLIGLVRNPKGFIQWMKDIFIWNKNDFQFLFQFPLEFFGFAVKIPEQGQFNGGEKMNSLVTGGSCVLLAISGLIMWFPTAFSPAIVRLAYPIHDITMILATTMVCMHAYLGSFHPGSGESFWGMWNGTVKADWAKHHHARWYRDNYGE